MPLLMNENIRKRELEFESVISEIKIPTLWGFIAAKKYHKKVSDKTDILLNSNLPILCFHGWLDNCGTFDRLIPLIQEKHQNLEFLSFDWPGHGLSSHRPNTMMVGSMDYLYDIARIVDYLKLSESGFHAMGHSMGGNALMQYYTLFPNQIKSLITIESTGVVTSRENNFQEILKNSINGVLRFENSIKSNKQSKLYTFDQAIARVKMGSKVKGTIDDEYIHILLKRGMKQVGNAEIEGSQYGNSTNEEKLYKFSRDVKLIIPSIGSYTKNMAQQLFNNYKTANFPHLFIVCNQLLWFSNDAIKFTRENIFSIFETNPKFKILLTEGNHHCHLNNPECFVEQINKWIGGETVQDSSFDDYLNEIKKFQELKACSDFKC